MKTKFANYQISLELKELGFNEKCLFVYNSYESLKHIISGTNSDIDDYISYNKYDDRLFAPLLQDVIDWFRDEHLLELLVLPQDKSLCDPTPLYFIAIESYKSGDMVELFNSTIEPMLHYDCYYEAREAVIRKAIEIIKENKL